MTPKDWILLLVPICANGVVIYLVQALFQAKLKRSEHKDEMKQKINSQFFSLLLEIKSNFRILGRSIINAPNDTESINLYLANYNQSIGKALEYYSDYSFYLKDYASAVAQLDSTFDEYMESMRIIIKAQLNNESRKVLEKFVNKLFQLTCNIADLYSKNI